ncbi:hypothetical protein E2P81_ATG06390 [Venturia nashicola]|nr:hypothetical protein E2P81_ATG06390 [Venturia nashicola]
MADRATDVVVAGEVMELMHDRAEDEEEQGWDGRILEDLGWRGSMRSREQTDLEKGEIDVEDERGEDGRGEERESGEHGDRESSQHSPRLQDRKLEDQGADAADEKGDRRKNDAAVEKDDRREDGEERQSEIERQSNPDSRERSPCAWDRTSDDRESMPQRDSGDRERSPRPWDLSPEDREDSFSVLATNDDLRAQEEDQERMQRKKGRRERSRQRSEKERLKRRSLSPRRGNQDREIKITIVKRRMNQKDHGIGSGHQIEDSWNISHVEHIAIDRGLLICGIAIGSEITNLDHETHIVGVDLHFFNVEVKEMAVKLGLIEIARFHGSVEGTLQSLNKGADRAHRIGVKKEKEHRLNRKLEVWHPISTMESLRVTFVLKTALALHAVNEMVEKHNLSVEKEVSIDASHDMITGPLMNDQDVTFAVRAMILIPGNHMIMSEKTVDSMSKRPILDSAIFEKRGKSVLVNET